MIEADTHRPGLRTALSVVGRTGVEVYGNWGRRRIEDSQEWAGEIQNSDVVIIE